MEKKMWSVYLPKDLYDYLKLISEENYTTMSKMFVQLLVEHRKIRIQKMMDDGLIPGFSKKEK